MPGPQNAVLPEVEEFDYAAEVERLDPLVNDNTTVPAYIFSGNRRFYQKQNPYSETEKYEGQNVDYGWIKCRNN